MQFIQWRCNVCCSYL